jgi:hypothetical protein
VANVPISLLGADLRRGLTFSLQGVRCLRDLRRMMKGSPKGSRSSGKQMFLLDVYSFLGKPRPWSYDESTAPGTFVLGIRDDLVPIFVVLPAG